ncbi:hypothetical protein D3C81_2300170 [compost metagenome]
MQANKTQAVAAKCSMGIQEQFTLTPPATSQGIGHTIMRRVQGDAAATCLGRRPGLPVLQGLIQHLVLLL